MTHRNLMMNMVTGLFYVIAIVLGIWAIPIWWKSLLLTIEIFSYFPLMWVLAPLAALQGVLMFFWMYPEHIPKKIEFLKENFP